MFWEKHNIDCVEFDKTSFKNKIVKKKMQTILSSTLNKCLTHPFSHKYKNKKFLMGKKFDTYFYTERWGTKEK